LGLASASCFAPAPASGEVAPLAGAGPPGAAVGWAGLASAVSLPALAGCSPPVSCAPVAASASAPAWSACPLGGASAICPVCSAATLCVSATVWLSGTGMTALSWLASVACSATAESPASTFTVSPVNSPSPASVAGVDAGGTTLRCPGVDLDRRRMTVGERRSSTRFSWRSFSSARLTR
jgi:hypothetical protein